MSEPLPRAGGGTATLADMNINGVNTFDLVMLTSQPIASGRRCQACLGPISVEDDFGLSEGICRRCARRKPASQREGRSSLLSRLRRAA